MPVRPSAKLKGTAWPPPYAKPAHLRAKHERDFAVARDLLDDPTFVAACRSRGVEPTRRQARKHLRAKAA